MYIVRQGRTTRVFNNNLVEFITIGEDYITDINVSISGTDLPRVSIDFVVTHLETIEVDDTDSWLENKKMEKL